MGGFSQFDDTKPDGRLFFYGINRKGRAVFMHRDGGHFYGTRDIFFNRGAGSYEVLFKVKEEDLGYMGRDFEGEILNPRIPKYLEIEEEEYADKDTELTWSGD